MERKNKPDSTFFMYLLTAAVLIFSVWSTMNRSDEMARHQQFFTEVRGFISAGPRNTAKMGYDMCIRVVELQARHPEFKKPPLDCVAIYYHGDIPETTKQKD